MYKKRRLGPVLLGAARAHEHYNAAHAFIGGTGAVGGASLLQMLSMYAEMFSITTPKPDRRGDFMVHQTFVSRSRIDVRS
jgi:hypothetical protein